MGFAQGFTAVGPRLVNVDGILATVAGGASRDATALAPTSATVVGGAETTTIPSPATSTNVGGSPGASSAGIGVAVEVAP